MAISESHRAGDGFSRPRTPLSPLSPLSPSETEPLGGGVTRRFRSWLSGLEFIKTFQLTEHISWGEVVIESRWLDTDYRRPDLEDEFRRFACRDLNPLIVASFVWGGALFFNFIFSMGPLWWYHICVTCPLTGVLIAAEAYLFLYKRALTPEIARIRYWIIVAIGLMTAYATSFAFEQCYERCAESVELYGDIFGKYPDPPTPERVRRYCTEIVIPFPILSINIGLVALRLRPLHHTVLVLVEFVLVSCGLLMLRRSPSATIIGLKVAWTALFSLCSIVLVFLREWLLRAQFELAVSVTQCSLSAQARQAEVDTLLCATLPASALARVMKQEAVADSVASATVIFSDIVQFTRWSSTRTASQVVRMLNALCIEFDTISTSLRVEKVKTIGDAYWAAAGVPEWFPLHAQAVCEMGLRMLDTVAQLNVEHPEWEGINLRIGVHSGPLAAGMPGTQRLSYEVFGPTSHIAEEVEQAGRAKRVAVSETTHRLVSGRYNTELFDTLEVHEGEVLQLFLIARKEEASVDGAGEPLSSKLIAVAGLDNDHAHGRTHLLGHADGLSDGASVSMACDSEAGALMKADREQRAAFLQKRKRKRTARAGAAAAAAASPASRRASVVEADEVFSPANAADEDLGDATGDALAAEMMQRRFPVLLLTFRDAAQEARFLAFAEERNRSLRIASRLVMLVLMIFVIVSQEIQGLSIPTGAPLGLVVSAIVLWAGATCEVIFADRFWLAENTALFGASVMFVVGCGITPEGLAVNDLCHLAATFISVFAFAIVRIPTAVLTAICAVVVVTPNLVLNLRAYIYFINFLFYLTLLALFFFIAYTNERFLRQQFVEQAVAEHLHRVIEEQNAAQREVLLSIVPAHIVPSLVEWFAGGLRVDRSIALHYRHGAVCFVKVELIEPVHQAAAAAGQQSGHRNSLHLPQQTQQTQEQHETPLPQLCVSVPLPDMGVVATAAGSTPAAAVPSPPVLAVSSTGTFGDASDPAALENRLRSAADAHMAHLLHMHALIDRIASAFPAVDKIKTIGDLVMFAGPFAAPCHGMCEDLPEGSSPPPLPAVVADAVHASLGIFFNMTRHLPNADMWCGVHIGDIVGAVVGTKRISFDVFGDTVNTASRTMGTSTKGILAMTTEAAGALASFTPPKVQPAATSVATHDFSWTVGPVLERAAKGKGFIRVVEVSLAPR